MAEQEVVFLLNLEIGQDFQGLFDAIYEPMVDRLATRYRLPRARKGDAARRWLSNADNHPIAILAVDPGVIKVGDETVLQQLRQYVQAGGLVIFMASFSSFMSVPDMNAFWAKHWGLSWETGSYHRTDHHFNRYSHGLNEASLELAYSQKALCLKNVIGADCLYLPTQESRTQSAVFAPAPVDLKETPIALTRLGHGWLAYIGDVNNEVGTQKVVMEIIDFVSRSGTR